MDKNKFNNTLSDSYNFGKLPPQAIDMEEAVLGAIMLENNAIFEVSEILKPECFYKQSHQLIYTAIIEINKHHKNIDILTVTEYLKKSGELDTVGGPFYITQLTNRVASAANIIFHARIIIQKYIQREMIRISTEIQNMAFDESQDIDDILNFAESEIFKISNQNIKTEPVKLSTIINERITLYYELCKKEAKLIGVPSGLVTLDRVTNGFQNSDFIIIAARPSIGKTFLALHFSLNCAQLGKKVAIFSLEMSKGQLADRINSIKSGIAQDKIKSGKLSNSELASIEDMSFEIIDYGIYIDDTPALNIYDLRSKLIKLKLKVPIDIVFIDYVQLMKADVKRNENREREISKISQACKLIAKELNIPVVALSQLNRECEGKRPNLSNLRESGSLEQDADLIIFPYREKEQNNVYSLNIELIIAKHRNGKIGAIDVRLEDESFTNILENETPF